MRQDVFTAFPKNILNVRVYTLYRSATNVRGKKKKIQLPAPTSSFSLYTAGSTSSLKSLWAQFDGRIQLFCLKGSMKIHMMPKYKHTVSGKSGLYLK